jgi:hypothetical protein
MIATTVRKTAVAEVGSQGLSSKDPNSPPSFYTLLPPSLPGPQVSPACILKTTALQD